MFTFDVKKYQELQDELSNMTWTLSAKKRKVRGREYTYYYKQYRDSSGKRREQYIRRRDQADILGQFAEKTAKKAELRQLQSELAAMDRRQRKNAKKMDFCYQALEIDAFLKDNAMLGQLMRCEAAPGEELRVKQVAGDGKLYESREEIILDEICRAAGIVTVHNEELDPANPNTRTIDFTFEKNGKKFYWEHFGKISDPDYARKQQFKLQEYARRSIVPGDNLIITSSPNNQFILPLVLWQLLIYEILDPDWVIRTYHLDQKMDPQTNHRHHRSFEIRTWY